MQMQPMVEGWQILSVEGIKLLFHPVALSSSKVPALIEEWSANQRTVREKRHLGRFCTSDHIFFDIFSPASTNEEWDALQTGAEYHRKVLRPPQ